MKLLQKVRNLRRNSSADLFLEITMKLGEKYGNTRSIRSEDLFFFRDYDDFGRKIGNTRSKTFFLKNTIFWESLPQAPNYEYPSLPLASVDLEILQFLEPHFFFGIFQKHAGIQRIKHKLSD